MTRRRIASLTAFLGLGALVVGVPICLSLGGWPLPTSWPNWAAGWTDMHLGYVPSAFAFHVALCAAWLAWGFLSYEIVVESALALRRASSRKRSALGPLQPFLAKVIATTFLSVPIAAATRPLRPVPDLAMATAALRVAAPDLASSAPPSPPPPTASQQTSQLPIYVVQKGDTLWGIATRLLGDPYRWVEIAKLNEGRIEGTTRFENPNWIYPGWTLLLPADAQIQSPPPIPSEASPAAPQSTAHMHASGDVPSSTTVAREPSTSPASNASKSVRVPATTTPAHQELTTIDGTHRDREPVTADEIGLGLLGVGVLGVLERMRRAQQRRRRLGRRIPMPSGEVALIERTIGGNDSDGPSWVAGTLRLLGSLLRDGAEPFPRIAGVRLRVGDCEILLQDPEQTDSSPPEPFYCSDHGWTIERREVNRDPIASAASAPIPTPALVTLGYDGSDPVLVNLEEGGVFCIAGDEEMALGVIRSAALELSTARWAEAVQVRAVGIEPVPGLDRLEVVNDLEDCLAELRSHSTEAAKALSEGGFTGTAEARLYEADGSWSPLVIVLTRMPNIEALSELHVLVEEGLTSAAVILPGELGFGQQVEIDSDGSIELPQLPLRLRAQGLAPAQLSGIAGLLSVAALTEDVETLGDEESKPAENSAIRTRDPSPPKHPDPAVPESEPATSSLVDLSVDESDVTVPASLGVERGHEIEIALLGPLEVRGALRDARRPKTLELLVWLAMHPEGGDTDAVVSALWPNSRPGVDAIAQRVWDVRSMLGTDPAGSPHLPKHRGLLQLGPYVRNDWDVFRRFASDATPEGWAKAMELVRGEPFAGTDYRWAAGLSATMVSSIVDVGMRLGEWAIQARDPSLATWAAERTIAACRYDERPYRLLMLAADLTGSRKGVDAAMDRLSAALELDVEPFDYVHPETVELYGRLKGKSHDLTGGAPWGKFR